MAKAKKQHKYVDFDLKLLKELASKEDSLVTVHRSEHHIALPPWHFSNLDRAIKDQLNRAVLSYDEKHGGILLAYENLKSLADFGRIYNNGIYAYYNIIGDFFIFRPEIGRSLNATVTKKNNHSVICSVYNCFTVLIPRPSTTEGSEETWIGDAIHVGDEIQIRIDYINLQKISIKGTILKKIKDGNRINKKLVFDDSFDPEPTTGDTALDSVQETLDASDSQSRKKSKKKKKKSSEPVNTDGDEMEVIQDVIIEEVHQDEVHISSETEAPSEEENTLQMVDNGENRLTFPSQEERSPQKTAKNVKAKKERRNSLYLQDSVNDQENESAEVKVRRKRKHSETANRSESEISPLPKKRKKAKSSPEKSAEKVDLDNSREQSGSKMKKKLVSDNDKRSLESIEEALNTSGSRKKIKNESKNISVDDVISNLLKEASHKIGHPIHNSEQNTSNERNEFQPELHKENASHAPSVKEDSSEDKKTNIKAKKKRRNSLFIQNDQHIESVKSDTGEKQEVCETMNMLEPETSLRPDTHEESKLSSMYSLEMFDSECHEPNVSRIEKNESNTIIKSEKPEKKVHKSKIKIKSEKQLDCEVDKVSAKKVKRRKSVCSSLELSKDEIVNQELEKRKQELEQEEDEEEDYSKYSLMQIKQEEISLPDLDMNAVLESTKLENSSLRDSSLKTSLFSSKIEMSDDSSLERILASPVKLEYGDTPVTPKKKKKVKKEKL